MNRYQSCLTNPDSLISYFRTPSLSARGILALALALSGCGGGGNDGGSSNGGNGGTGNGTGGSSGVGGSSGSGGGSQKACQSTASPGEMVSVPAGEFKMGCNEATDDQCKPESDRPLDSKPLRTITLQAFQIDKVEVTQDQYSACVGAGACEAPSCDWDCGQTSLPASCVTFNDAKDFCTWAGKRLPTEAEWEKAARGADGRKYPWGNDAPSCSLVNMSGCKGGASPAGAYPSGASPYGALDMAGNMVEMVNDWYDKNYYGTAPLADPKGPASGTQYVGRGGGWKSPPTWQRTFVRDWYVATDTGKSLGFRCAK